MKVLTGTKKFKLVPIKTCPKIKDPCWNSENTIIFTAWTPLNENYAMFLKPIFFWDTLYNEHVLDFDFINFYEWRECSKHWFCIYKTWFHRLHTCKHQKDCSEYWWESWCNPGHEISSWLQSVSCTENDQQINRFLRSIQLLSTC